MPVLYWIWASTFVWFVEPIPQKTVPWRFWMRLIIWMPVVYGIILPICFALVFTSVIGMFIYDSLFRLRILREREQS